MLLYGGALFVCFWGLLRVVVLLASTAVVIVVFVCFGLLSVRFVWRLVAGRVGLRGLGLGLLSCWVFCCL